MSQSDESEEDFLIDEELQEIEKQLMADADHLHSLYPSLNARRLDDLVSKCLVASKGISSDDASEDDEIVEVAHQSRSSKWVQLTTAISLCVTLGIFVWVWAQPENTFTDQTAETGSSNAEVIVTRPVSINSMPREFLNASQPELEAIYDMMPNESVSVEF